MASALSTRGQELNTLQMIRRQTKSQEFQQIGAGTAANFQNSHGRQIRPPQFQKKVRHGSLALLRRKQDRAM
jgi:hypothetical protein